MEHKSSGVLFSCRIPGRPRIQKNGARIARNALTGRRFITKSERFDRWALYAWSFLVRAKTHSTITVPVNMTMRIYLKNHQHEMDLSNAYQGVEDLLQKTEVLKNDKLIYSHDGSRKIFAPDEPERVEIELRAI